MNLYTIGFTQKSAEEFFGLIKKYKIEMLVDIRLNNKSQLAGFSKGKDLEYFLDEICNCKYEHCIEYAPSKEILDNYKKRVITWDDYVNQYVPMMQKRKVQEKFLKKFLNYNSVCLLCSEPTPEKCHRRLLAEMIAEGNSEIIVKHI